MRKDFPDGVCITVPVCPAREEPGRVGGGHALQLEALSVNEKDSKEIFLVIAVGSVPCAEIF